MAPDNQAYRRNLWWICAPIIAAVILVGLGREIGPSYAAVLGHGRPGTFTATRQDCSGGPGACTWRGEFKSDDGLVTRSDVALATGLGPRRVGDRIRARDMGNRSFVYPRDWSRDWLFMTLLVIGSFVFLAISVVIWVRRAARRLRK